MRQIAFFAGIFLVGASAFAADSQLMNLVMPDAQVMAGINVTTATISPFGQYVISKIGSNDTGLQSFISTTGFDPRHDVTEILVASNGDPGKPGGLVLAKGNFTVDKLVAAISKESNQTVATYGGATLISSADPKNAYGVAFLGSSIAVAGDIALVKAAVDRSTGVNSVSPALATRVQALSSSQDAWSVSLASIASLVPSIAGDAMKGPAAVTFGLVKNIQSSSGGVKFGDNVVVTGQAVADTAENATALADVMRMVTSLAAMGAAGQSSAGASLAALVQKIQITTAGTAVNVAATIPESDLESALKMIAAQTAGVADKAPAARKTRM